MVNELIKSRPAKLAIAYKVINSSKRLVTFQWFSSNRGGTPQIELVA